MDMPKLWTAMLSGQYHLVNQMIYLGANLNELRNIKYYWLTLLHVAVIKSDVRFIRILANLGANFNVGDDYNRTPMHWAAARGVGLDIFEELINGGADVDARDNFQRTPLFYAALRNHIESAEMLIDRGASIDARDRNRRSVLHVAIKWSDLKLVKMLISHKVNINAKDNHGETLLLSYFGVYLGNKEHSTEIVQLLLDNGADVNPRRLPLGNYSILLLAAKRNHLDSVHLLLKRGARVNHASDRGETALHVACQWEWTHMTALLLKFRANLNARNNEGKAAFELLPSEASAQIIIKEAVKRNALGKSLYVGYKEMIQSCENYSKFDLECREEIKRMQSEKIDKDSAVSFFDIITMDKKKLAAVAANKKTITAFESSGCVASFRIYASELTPIKFEMAKKIAQKLAGYIKNGYMI